MTSWRNVPYAVVRQYIKYANTARELVAADVATVTVETDCGPAILVKDAAVLETPWKAYGGAQRIMGGPNPLTAALVGGALGAGLGYGGGWLTEKLFPKQYMERGKLRRNAAIVSGLLGAGLPLYAYGRPQMAEHGFKGLFQQGPYWRNSPATTAQQGLAKASAEFDLEPLPVDDFLKQATSAGGAFLPKISVDHFNRMILDDPFTPQNIAAATTGLVSAAATAHGGAKLVSPFDVGRIAVGMGSGAVSGMLVGKVLGALAGITPKAQQGLQRAGVMAGLLANVVPRAFGG